jgi:hypothetical protein
MSVDGMIVAASTTLLAESLSGGGGGFLPWALLVAGSVASLAANVAVAEPTVAGRIIAAWPSFSLIAAYELLMRQVRCAAETAPAWPRSRRSSGPAVRKTAGSVGKPAAAGREAGQKRVTAGRDERAAAWQWAQCHRAEDGSLPPGREIARQYGRHERWGRLVKRSGLGATWGAGLSPGSSAAQPIAGRVQRADCGRRHRLWRACDHGSAYNRSHGIRGQGVGRAGAGAEMFTLAPCRKHVSMAGPWACVRQNCYSVSACYGRRVAATACRHEDQPVADPNPPGRPSGAVIEVIAES